MEHGESPPDLEGWKGRRGTKKEGILDVAEDIGQSG